MDEPTVGLDPASRADLLKLLLTMRRERSVAVLWATHLCEEVDGADRVIVLHRGKVLTDTTPTLLVESTGAPSIEAGIFVDDRAAGCAGMIGDGRQLYLISSGSIGRLVKT